MDFDEFSEEQLVTQFLLASSEGRKEEIRDRLFARYYREFEMRIVAVLRSRGMSNSPSDLYFNEIFKSVYERVFALERFEKKLKTFDSSKGAFDSWLLIVVGHEVGDWLKEVDSTTGMKNTHLLKIEQEKRSNALFLDSPVSDDKDAFTHGTKITSLEVESPADFMAGEESLEIFDLLLMKDRVYLAIFMVTYRTIETSEIKCIEKISGKDVGQIKREIKKIKSSLEGKYEESLKIDEKIACMGEMIPLLEGRAYKLRKSLSLSDEEIEKKNTTFLLSELEAENKKLYELFSQKKIPSEEYFQKRQINHYKITSKRLKNVVKKREKLIKEKISKKHFVSPSYKEIAGVLRVTDGAVRSKMSRIFETLRNNFPNAAFSASV